MLRRCRTSCTKSRACGLPLQSLPNAIDQEQQVILSKSIEQEIFSILLLALTLKIKKVWVLSKKYSQYIVFLVVKIENQTPLNKIPISLTFSNLFNQSKQNKLKRIRCWGKSAESVL
jgi:hypothetical protein